jgi:hypothetical protein
VGRKSKEELNRIKAEAAESLRKSKEHHAHELALNIYAVSYLIFFISVIFGPNIGKAISGSFDTSANINQIANLIEFGWVKNSNLCLYVIMSISTFRFVLGSLFVAHDNTFRKTLFLNRQETYENDIAFTMTLVKLLMSVSLMRTYFLFYGGFQSNYFFILSMSLLLLEALSLCAYDIKFRKELLMDDPDKLYNSIIVILDAIYIAFVFIVIAGILPLILHNTYVSNDRFFPGKLIEVICGFYFVIFILEFVFSYFKLLGSAFKQFGSGIGLIWRQSLSR